VWQHMSAHTCARVRPRSGPTVGEVSVGPTDCERQIIEKLGLQGTLLEQLVMRPGALSDPERYVESPSLMRFAMDVRRALSAEGWEATSGREP
jgi:hypothetical protein